jgi:hypothetical protein
MDTEQEGDKVKIFLAASGARWAVEELFGLSLGLTVCKAARDELFSAIGNWQQSFSGKPLEKIDAAERLRIREMAAKAKAFEMILTAELQTLDAYHPSKKGIYSTRDLITEADRILGPIHERLTPDVAVEIRQSGRCLAFDNATASGFHIMRATEALMHQYYLTVCKPKHKDRLDNWGEYLAAFRACTHPHAHEVAALLQQIKDQHRNPIMHPEVVLTVEEAFTLFEVAKAAIITMASKLKPSKAAKTKKPPQTSPE